MAKFKHPSAAAAQFPNQQTAATDNASRPVFCLRHLQKGYDVSALSKEQKVAVLDRLDQMRQMSWGQITLAPRHGAGKENIAVDSLKKPLPAGVSPDVTIMAFRCFGIMPILGFRRDNVLHLVWLDPNGDLYEH